MTASTIAGRQPAAWQARLRAALPGHLERRTWDAARLRAHQRDRLRALLRHAKSRSRSTPSAWPASTRRGSSSPTCPRCRP
jgi:hypothetical protein